MRSNITTNFWISKIKQIFSTKCTVVAARAKCQSFNNLLALSNNRMCLNQRMLMHNRAYLTSNSNPNRLRICLKLNQSFLFIIILHLDNLTNLKITWWTKFKQELAYNSIFNSKFSKISFSNNIFNKLNKCRRSNLWWAWTRQIFRAWHSNMTKVAVWGSRCRPGHTRSRHKSHMRTRASNCPRGRPETGIQATTLSWECSRPRASRSSKRECKSTFMARSRTRIHRHFRTNRRRSMQ